MNIFQKIFQNQVFKVSSLNSLAILARVITGFVSSKAIAYFIGPSGMALMGNLRNFTTIIENIGILGLQNGIVKTVANYQDEKEEATQFVANVFWSLFYVVLALCLVLVFGNSFFGNQIFGSNYNYYYILYFVAFFLPFQVFHLFFIAIINGFSLYKKVIEITIYSTLLGLFISLILMWKFGVYGALISISALSFFQFLFSGSYFQKLFTLNEILSRNKIDFQKLKNLLPLGLMTLFSATIGAMIYIFIRNLICKTASLEAAGYYEAMLRISGFYMLFISSLITFYFLPELSKNKDSFSERTVTFNYYKTIIPVFLVGLIVLYLSRNLTIQFLLNKSFLPVSDLFFWQMIGDFFRAMSLILGIRFYYKKIVKVYFLTEIISFGALFLLSYLLIPIYYANGAVMAYGLTNVLYFIVLCVYFRKFIFLRPNS